MYIYMYIIYENMNNNIYMPAHINKICMHI